MTFPTGITTRDGLLWREDQMIGAREGDRLAQQCGMMYAEQLVKALEQRDRFLVGAGVYVLKLAEQGGPDGCSKSGAYDWLIDQSQDYISYADCQGVVDALELLGEVSQTDNNIYRQQPTKNKPA